MSGPSSAFELNRLDTIVASFKGTCTATLFKGVFPCSPGVGYMVLPNGRSFAQFEANREQFAFSGGHDRQHDAPPSPPSDGTELIQLLNTADLPSHVILRRVYDAFLQKIKIAAVGFRRDGDEYLFDDECDVVTEKWLRDRAHSRLAYAEPE